MTSVIPIDPEKARATRLFNNKSKKTFVSQKHAYEDIKACHDHLRCERTHESKGNDTGYRDNDREGKQWR